MRRFAGSQVIQILILIVCVGMGFLAIGPLRAAGDRRAEVIKNRIIGQLEQQMNVRISYDSVSPALLAAVTVRGLEVEFEEGRFETTRLRVFYNPLRQIDRNSDDPARMITRVSVDGGRFELDLRNREADEGAARNRPMDPELWKLISNKVISLSDVTADVRTDAVYQGTANLDRVVIRHDGNLVRYEIAGDGEVNDPEIYALLGLVSARWEARGSFSPDDSSVNGRLDLERAESQVIALAPTSVDYTFDDGTLTVRRLNDDTPIDLSASWSGDRWNIRGEAENLVMNDIVSPGPDRRSWDPWFQSTVNGTFDLGGAGFRSGLDYGIAMSLSIPEIEGLVPVQAAVGLSGDEDSVKIETLDVATPWGDVAYSGDFLVRELAPRGRLGMAVHEQILGYPVKAVFDLDYAQGAVTAEPVVFDAAGQVFDDFRFLVIREESSVALSLLVVPGKPGDGGNSRILLDALMEFGDEPVLHGFVGLEDVDAASLARLAGGPSLEGLPFIKGSRFAASGMFEANAESWVLSVDDATLSDRDDPDNSISLSGRMTQNLWALDGLHVSWNDYVADGRVYARRFDGGGLAEGRFIIEDQVYPIDGRWDDDGLIRIEGDYGTSLVVGPPSAGGRMLRLTADGLTVPLKQGRLAFDADVRGRYARGDWEFFIDNAQAALQDRPGVGDMSVRMNGTVEPGRISLPDIRYTDTVGAMAGNASFDFSGGPGDLRGRLRLGGITGESYDIYAARKADDWDLRLDVRSARMERMQPERLSGLADISGSFRGPLDDPEMVLELSTRDGFLDGQSFEAGASANLSGGRFRLHDVLFRHEGVSLTRGLALVNLENGTIRSTAEMEATFNQVPVSSGFSMGMDFGRKLLINDIGKLGRLPFSGTLATRPILWDTREHIPDFTFHFSRTDDDLTIRTPDGETLDLAYDYRNGMLEVTSGGKLPIIVNGGGRISNGQLDLSFPDLSIDPVLINYVMIRDPILLQYHVVFQDGRFAGNLDIRGPSGDPDLFGEIRAENLKVDTPYTYADISPASTDIRLEGNRITVDTIQIPVGDGFVYGGGYIVIDSLSLTEFNMTYGGRGGPNSKGVPIYYPLLGVNLDGHFFGEVHMTGDGQRFYLDADITFPDLKASLGSPVVPVPQRKPGKFPKPVYLDFNFVTGNNCTFFLPNEQLKIVRATAESGQVINFTYSSVPKTLTLTGTLPIRSGNIYYFDRDFQVTDGALMFNETLGAFDPMLDFRAETRVMDDGNDEVTVALVYNAPIKSDFNPGIETIPSRSELEILELFGQAVVPYADSQEAQASTVLLATGGMFAQAGIVQPFEDVIRESLNLDMVTIRTDIIENTLSEGLVRNDETDSEYTSSGLGRYLDNTSLYAGKYIGNALFVSGTIAATYFEGQRNQSVFGGLEFETSVSFEMETPFFNVAWSYSPDPTRDQNFVADNEISLKWQFSY